MRQLAFLCAGLIGVGATAAPACAETVPISRSGQFQDADTRHQGAGVATLSPGADGRAALTLTEFSVTPGPDLEVWLVADPAPGTSAAVLASDWISLGPLQAPEGPQEYTLPDDVDAAAYGSVVIWCGDFSVLFAVAPLR